MNKFFEPSLAFIFKIQRFSKNNWIFLIQKSHLAFKELRDVDDDCQDDDRQDVTAESTETAPEVGIWKLKRSYAISKSPIAVMNIEYWDTKW